MDSIVKAPVGFLQLDIALREGVSLLDDCAQADFLLFDFAPQIL